MIENIGLCNEHCLIEGVRISECMGVGVPGWWLAGLVSA